MTVSDIISTVNRLKPNAYDDTDKAKWLSEVEGMIFDELVKASENGKDDHFYPIDYDSMPDRKLYADDRFSQLYVYYLFSKIDFMDNNIAQYNNDTAMFNAEYENFCSWFIRNNTPKKQGGFYV